jgi:predicted nucleic acid-binding protein
VILLDTSGLLAALFADQRRHEECKEALLNAEPTLLLSPFVLAELDYLVTRLAGVGAEKDLLAEVARGAFELASMTANDVDKARNVINRYEDLGIGLADASLVVLSNRHETVDVLTLDERHFRVMRGWRGRPFRILPADS